MHAADDALDQLRAFAGMPGPHRSIPALSNQAPDLAIEVAHRGADQQGGLTGRLRQALHFAGNDGKALACFAGAGRLDGRVQGQQIGLLRNRFDRDRHFCDLLQSRANGGETLLHPSDGPDQFRDVLHCVIDARAGVREFAHRHRGRRLYGLRCAGDFPVCRDHGFGGALQVPEAARLIRDPTGHVLQIAGDVGEFDAKAADLVGQLVDKTGTVQSWLVKLCGRRRKHD